MSKTTKAERSEALDRLRELVPAGSTVYTVLRSVSRSGMQRGIDLYTMPVRDGVAEPRWLSRFAGRALGITFDESRECLKVNGAGMDMGFHVVYELSHALHGDGKALSHRWL